MWFGEHAATILELRLAAKPEEAATADDRGDYPLHHAARRNSLAMVRALLSAYPDGRERRNSQGRMPGQEHLALYACPPMRMHQELMGLMGDQMLYQHWWEVREALKV